MQSPLPLTIEIRKLTHEKRACLQMSFVKDKLIAYFSMMKLLQKFTRETNTNIYVYSFFLLTIFLFVLSRSYRTLHELSI